MKPEDNINRLKGIYDPLEGYRVYRGLKEVELGLFTDIRVFIMGRVAAQVHSPVWFIRSFK